MDKKNVPGESSNIALNMSQRMPQTIVDNDFIFYDKNERSFMARNCQSINSRKIDLYQAYDYSGNEKVELS